MLNEQDLFYNSFVGGVLGGKAREEIVDSYLNKVKSNDKFLEVGCSSGHYIGKISEVCNEPIGVDIDEKKISRAKKLYPKGKFQVINGNGLPFENNSFDWVLCTEVLEHIPEYEKTLEEIKRVARGKVLITIPLEDAKVWKTVSRIGFGMWTRGHVHALWSKDIEGKMDGFKLLDKQFVCSPSRRLNKKYFQNPKEKDSMYSIMLFEKKI